MPTSISANEGLYSISGMYGYVVMDGHVRAEIQDLTATITVAKVDVPLVGHTSMGHKPGRETRDGTFTVRKIDTYWEKYMFQFFSQSLAQRRAARGTQAGAMRPFDLQVWLDDPEALGAEVWQLNGCLVWDMPLGFNITTDLLDRQFTFSWESETPLETFQINHPIVPNPLTGQPSITLLDTVDPGSPTS